MSSNDDAPRDRVERLLDTPDLVGALESDHFKQFLDHIPIAVAVSELRPREVIIYANMEFERLTTQSSADIEGRPWEYLRGEAVAGGQSRLLHEAVADEHDYIGAFTIERDGSPATVDVWSNIIQDENGTAVFRLIAMADADRRGDDRVGELADRIREKDLLLRELQHRVKNNLQMITALIRLEARNMPDDRTAGGFDRLAGRVEALALLYRFLSTDELSQRIDLGVYLSEIASAVMHAHSVEGIHLDLQVDSWTVSLNIAMPVGLVVNEVLTNALKYAFIGRSTGSIKLHCLVDDNGCRVTVADDGIGLAPGVRWPEPGKLSAMIVRSLRENANSDVEVRSTPESGMEVSMYFSRAADFERPSR